MWCSSCKKDCNAITIDIGIGPYEYWGSKGVDRKYVEASDCCHENLLDHDPFCSECGAEEIYEEGMCFKCYEAEVAA